MFDSRIIEAIRLSANDMNQPSAVADRLIAWLDAISSGNEQLDSRDDAKRRCEEVYNAVLLTEADIKDEN